MIEDLFTWIFSTWYNTVLVLFCFFNLLYWSSALIARFYLQNAFAKGNVTSLAIEPEQPRQLRREMKNSMISIVVFSLQGILLQSGIHNNWLHISYEVTWRIIPEILILFLWNELHFYFVHRLLHLRFFGKRIHWMHHHSTDPTVFSTFSFHWVEAFFLGTVIFFPLLVYPFEALALLSLPISSIILNTLGHCNYDLFPNASSSHFSKFSNRHSLHHHKGKGNYGFMLPWLDSLFRTAIKHKS